ncbi:MAG: response regulator [Devosiaceae bacterium]|nr:response regulator [Devosiaceae bacterium]
MRAIGSPDILIVEDEPAILTSLEFILQHAGWKTQTVTDGEAAIRAVQVLLPKIMVLDLMLPKKNGFEVLKIIRGQSATKNLPVLILTAKGQQQDKQTAKELGASGFVTKPYANTDVIDAVADLIGTVSKADLSL